MPAGTTYEPIATTTLSSAQANVTFNSISGSYTDLVIVVNAGCSSNGDVMYMQFNGDTAGNYSNSMMFGSGTSVSGGITVNDTFISLSQGAGLGTGVTWNCISSINSYASANTHKTVLTRDNIASGGLYLGTEGRVSYWKATPAAINSIKFYTSAGNIVSGSTFTLYGILAA